MFLMRAGILIAAIGLSLSPALADETADFSEALSTAVTGAILADAYMQACDLEDPAGTEVRRDAMAGWSHRVDLPGYQRVLAGVGEALPDIQANIEQHEDMVRQAVLEEVIDDISACAEFSAKLREDVFDIGRPVQYLLRNADDFGIIVADVPTPPSSEEIEVVPLIMLSAQLTSTMEEVGSKAGARDDRDLREAREEYASAWLQRWPLLVVYGRVTGDDELREWRGDQQSAFFATCLSFFDESHETNMAGDIGEDRIVVGEVRWVRDEPEGGAIGLRECRIFSHDPAEAELASMPDDSAGLMLRGLEYGEAYAGPEDGLAMGDIDRVLYDAEFQNRLDGFGNGYIDRREDIYVLLRDGTAYRHEWNFAFTDLDMNLSRQREPDRWFTWGESAGSVTLTQSGGLDAGEEVDLSKARRLMPVPQGQILDQTYYYLAVGMGGMRSDRDYAFSSDGSLVHTRGGFVAGNFGTHYITVVGDEDVARSTYVFDGYTMIIDGPDGQERHFVAMFDGEDAGRPDELIIDGQVHWLRKADQ